LARARVLINYVSFSDPPANWDFHHNAYWTDSGGCGAGANKSFSSTELATDKEPIFCGCRIPGSERAYRVRHA